jgi:hypothetical protein
MIGAFFLVSITPVAAHAAGNGEPEGSELPAGSDAPRLLPRASVDVYYAYHDTPPPDRNATLATAAVRHNQFALGLASIGVKVEHAKLLGELVLQAGTSVDALYSSTSTVPFDNREVWKHVQVANIGWRASDDVSIEAGIFSSLLGNEVFPTFGNWNYTHAMMADVLPYYLAGVRARWNVTPALSLGAMVSNGWQTFQDANTYKSGGLRVEFRPTEWLAIIDGASVGPETHDDRVLRVFDDLVVRLQLHARLHVAAEGWVGIDRGSGRSSTYWATGAWVRWAFAEKTHVAARFERIVDDDGTLTGGGARRAAVSGEGQRLQGYTLTLGWQIHPMLLARAEALFRRSEAATPYFAGGSGPDAVRDRSTTFSASLAFSY